MGLAAAVEVVDDDPVEEVGAVVDVVDPEDVAVEPTEEMPVEAPVEVAEDIIEEDVEVRFKATIPLA